MPTVGFEPTISAGERPQTYASDRAATGTGFTNTLPTHFPLLLLFTFVFFVSLQLDSSLYFLLFLLSAFLHLSRFVFVCLSLSLPLSFCLHVYFNLFGLTVTTMIPETTLRAGRSWLRIPVAERDSPPPPLPKDTDRLCGPVSVLLHEYRVHSLRVRY